MNKLNDEQRRDFFKVIDAKSLKTVYQPIVSLRTGEVYAYEALSRITDKSVNISIADMFEIAGESGCLWKLEKICRSLAVENAVGKPENTKMFINVDGNVIQDREFISGFTKEYLSKYKLKADEVVFEVTERSYVEDHEILQKIVKHYGEQGFEIAIDDVGAGYSGLNRINYLRPQYLKIDIGLVHEVHKSKSQKSLVEIMVRHCKNMGYMLIAEGIETQEELKCLIDLGVDLGQGYYIAVPDEKFRTTDSYVKKQIKKYYEKKKNDEIKNKHVGELSKMGMVLYPGCNAMKAYNLFARDEKLEVIAVVDKKNRFFGMLDRSLFVTDDARTSFISEKTVSEMMNEDVLTMDEDESLKKAAGKAMMRSDKMCYAPFVVLKNGRYYGIVSVKDLVITLSRK